MGNPEYTHAGKLQSRQTNESFVIQLKHIRFVF